LEDGRRPFRALAVSGELAERALGLAYAGRHDALDDHLGLARHLEIDGLALHELERLAEHARPHLQLVVALVPAAVVGEDLVTRVQADGEGHRRGRLALLVLHQVRPVVAGRHPEAHLPRALHHGADNRLVADTGFRIACDGDPRAAIATRVAFGVGRN